METQLEPLVDMALEIGQKVKVSRLRDRVSKNVAAYLGKRGVVSQFKMVDGSDVGVVVEFEDNYTTWFFEDELSAIQ
ncbi:cytochrome b6f subunit PetP [Leptolyngbya subtilissima]